MLTEHEQEELRRILRDAPYTGIPMDEDAIITAILANTPPLELSDDFKERALKAMQEAELKRKIIGKKLSKRPSDCPRCGRPRKHTRLHGYRCRNCD